MAGTTGWQEGALPVGLTTGLLEEAASLPAPLGNRAAISAVTGAGLTAASQQYLFGNIQWGSVAVAGADGLRGGAWPGGLGCAVDR